MSYLAKSICAGRAKVAGHHRGGNDSPYFSKRTSGRLHACALGMAIAGAGPLTVAEIEQLEDHERSSYCRKVLQQFDPIERGSVLKWEREGASWGAIAAKLAAGQRYLPEWA